MNLIDIPTERMTAFTDFLLGLLVLGVFIYLFRLRCSKNHPRLTIWLWAFGLLTFASLVGSVAHGFAMSESTNHLFWQFINPALGLVIAMFVVAVVFDLWGQRAYRRMLPVMIVVAALFYGVTVLIPGTFLTFVAYEALAMLFALGGYIYLSSRKKLPGAWLLVAGVLVTMIAAVIQAVGTNGVVLFLGLDHNGVFHLVQMAGVLALVGGIQKGLVRPAI